MNNGGLKSTVKNLVLGVVLAFAGYWFGTQVAHYVGRHGIGRPGRLFAIVGLIVVGQIAGRAWKRMVRG
jgi:hypothetical protein